METLASTVETPRRVETLLPAELLPRLERARANANAALLAERGPHGHWEGELSSSALSTATAIVALQLISNAERGAHNAEKGNPSANGSDNSAFRNPHSAITSGLHWLAANQNPDGGWGDTTKSISNISTTTLCWAAFGCVPGAEKHFNATVERAENWLSAKAGGVTPDQLAPAIIARYGKDRTFSVPILTMCALAGRLGSGRDAWRWVIPLPFELAAVPHQLYGALRLPVVSYALPALIAIGQVRHHFLPTRNPLTRLLRGVTRERTLRLLQTIQPVNGGFLEATPLTSFVTMSLAGMGLTTHPVARRGVEFLRASQRPDGSWPIDTNLATWVTTLATNALPTNSIDTAPGVLDWLLGQQYRVEHPYTHAAPGGWAWTNLPGGVPDADDTPGAMLAALKLAPTDGRVHGAVAAAATWLLDLQNRDGGIPTFCRGWGALPFDRSSPDLTAHTLRAWLAFRDYAEWPLRARIDSAVPRAVAFLRRTQRADGAWIPLWFGHQAAPNDENPLYGTTRVLCALAEVERTGAAKAGDLIERAVSWLVANQNANGGWAGVKGPASSVEETALAIESLAGIVNLPGEDSPARRAALVNGTRWLVERVENGTWRESSPIGFYFARLWYFERLYPLIFSAAALNAVRG